MKGSKYAILKLVESSNFLNIINDLLKPTGAKVSTYDNWMPKSISYDKEAELNDFLKHNFNTKLSSDITKWWLHKDATTPNWDLIASCTINDKRGILLVEAKAHCYELENESKGKKLDIDASEDSKLNHQEIGKAIEQANSEINKKISGVAISRDNCYQLSNRVAHAWWLANQGIPVMLMYLGFQEVKDMNDGKNRLFTCHNDWQECFTKHAEQIGVDKIINKSVDCGNSKFITICRIL